MIDHFPNHGWPSAIPALAWLAIIPAGIAYCALWLFSFPIHDKEAGALIVGTLVACVINGLLATTLLSMSLEVRATPRRSFSVMGSMLGVLLSLVMGLLVFISVISMGFAALQH